MKKLFGEINLTWKKLIIAAIIAGVYTALMALIPITKDTSFRDIAIMLEWWILFGIIIIANSKSPLDSALKCFVFFLISQPLVYLIQVPFSSLGWKIFGYYKYWFIWTIACLPMGFIGYYIKKKNYLSIIILLPMFGILMFLGTGYLKSAIESFPHHLLSGIACFAIIIVVTLNLFDELKHKIITLCACVIIAVIMLVIGLGFTKEKFEVVKQLNQFEIEIVGDAEITYFAGTKEGNASLIPYEGSYNVKLNGIKGGEYHFTVTDEEDHNYNFEYYFDKDKNEVILFSSGDK